MKNKIILPLFQSIEKPTLELLLSLAEKEAAGNNLEIHICNNSLKSCPSNISNSKAICKICYNRGLKGISKLREINQNITVKEIKCSNKNRLQKNKTLNNIKLGAYSTISSHLRIDDLNHLSKYWKKILIKLIQSSIDTYNYFDQIQSNSSKFILYNGRLSTYRPIIELLKIKKIDYLVIDTFKGGKKPIIAKNDFLHSIKFNCDNAIKTYCENFKESEKIAEKFISKRINKLRVNDVVYTKHQKKNYIDPKIFEKNLPVMSIYTSSDDEYKYIGSDWGLNLFDQIEVIKYLEKYFSKKYQIVVKMHPNQAKIHKKTLEKYFKLEQLNLILLKPMDKTDTYNLINKSDLIINFCSTVGIEANWFRKPIIQIGPSLFKFLPAVNYVDSYDHLKSMIQKKTFKIMPRRASTIWFNYMAKFESDLPLFEFFNNQYRFNNSLINYPNSFIKFFYVIPKAKEYILKKLF